MEVGRAIGPAAAPVVPRALPGCGREFGAETAGLRRNTAYCAGVMVEVGGAAAAPHRLDVARALLPLLSAEETDRGVRDNAAGAAVRVLAADGFAIAKDTDAGPALLAATLAASASSRSYCTALSFNARLVECALTASAGAGAPTARNHSGQETISSASRRVRSSGANFRREKRLRTAEWSAGGSQGATLWGNGAPRRGP